MNGHLRVAGFALATCLASVSLQAGAADVPSLYREHCVACHGESRLGGIGPALLVPGGAIILGYAALAASPLPLLVATVQVVTRASEFSLAKPARETIYTRVGREWRYKAGAAIDTVVYRGGDLTFVWLHKLLSAFGSQVVFGAGLLVAMGMTLGAWKVVGEARKLPAARPPADPPA